MIDVDEVSSGDMTTAIQNSRDRVTTSQQAGDRTGGRVRARIVKAIWCDGRFAEQGRVQSPD
jgi:hypothetical protein